MITLGVELGLSVILSATRKRRLREHIVNQMAEAAEPIAEEIEAAAPERSGNLKGSVRVEKDRDELTITIAAGGTPETTKTSKNGVDYDEAVLTEYGTVNEPAHPFFWPVINARRQKLEDAGANAVDSFFEEDE